ncbi:response regulator [Candidatus Falkowbacteria bacterium CG_4_9_14_3_um_filter_36_9]|uniref:Response regulator n=2 Tax=Candidatus Falkowiibacteriota TaxID=1752728 RepID=A0A1J4TD33_9BACT|nr:MAG: response regulator [Candidatus Falkowbacteria bacterium CG1_02_37_44]PIV50288.1 MAG: response regulator [Candidatus Falkowbacteria bacterium CG02_land_8_20_14_3_00_36_14]PIX11620.1 MAG: response regulator [Candidatus Falkowbacteria bacterium CG_4_8_14_3_um_filter_36_11]PJA10457.1 MAG: response regulator [Candidatus Falkowbacteria bacterium CG_4_10_14_0_2_um_filter_36_22]PJB20743.1 MAG: response regulator [Candidatus Falkowbacteria bacterium CG_4_9_14_3_um_filter_36_9]
MANKKIKILLIEDDSFLLNMYATKFEMENFQVISAEDGVKGLKLSQEESPDIILLDIILPKLSGFEVLKKIKEDNKLKKIPVILLTNLSQKDDIDKCLQLGAQDYLIKAHFMPSEVVEKIKKILEKN